MRALWETVAEGRDPADPVLLASLCEQAERNSSLRTELLLYVQRKLFAEDELSCQAGAAVAAQLLRTRGLLLPEQVDSTWTCVLRLLQARSLSRLHPALIALDFVSGAADTLSQRKASELYTSLVRPWLCLLHLPWGEECGLDDAWSPGDHTRLLTESGAEASLLAALSLKLLDVFLTLERRIAPSQWLRHLNCTTARSLTPPSCSDWWDSFHAQRLAAVQLSQVQSYLGEFRQDTSSEVLAAAVRALSRFRRAEPCKTDGTQTSTRFTTPSFDGSIALRLLTDAENIGSPILEMLLHEAAMHCVQRCQTAQGSLDLPEGFCSAVLNILESATSHSVRTHGFVILLSALRSSCSAMRGAICARVDGDTAAWILSLCTSSTDSLAHAMLAEIGESMLWSDSQRAALGSLYLSIALRCSEQLVDSVSALQATGLCLSSATCECHVLRQKWLLRAFELLPGGIARSVQDDVLTSLELFNRAVPSSVSLGHELKLQIHVQDLVVGAAAFESLAAMCFVSEDFSLGPLSVFTRLCRFHVDAGSALPGSCETALLSSGNRLLDGLIFAGATEDQKELKTALDCFRSSVSRCVPGAARLAAEARLYALNSENSCVSLEQPTVGRAVDHAHPASDYEPSNEESEDGSDEDEGYRMMSEQV